MKLHTTTAAVALLASTLALSGCGDRVEQAAPPAAAPAPAIDYSNYLDAAEREALKRSQAPTRGYGTYLPGSDRGPAPATHDRRLVLDVRVDVPDSAGGSALSGTSGHGTQDRVRTVG